MRLYSRAPCMYISFPHNEGTMNPRELVDHILSGPADLGLNEPLRFRRRTRSNPCDFNEFLEALQSSKTIRDVQCRSQLHLGITEDEWVLLIKTLGSIRNIHRLEICCKPGSRSFHPFQAIADALNNARSLFELKIGVEVFTFPRDPSGLIALANAVRENTSLENFTWIDWCPRAPWDVTSDPVLRALPACTHLRKVLIMTRCASADAEKNLLQIQAATELHLVLEIDQWLAVADEIRRGRCNVQRLTLTEFNSSSSEATWTEAVKAVASAIRWDYNLEELTLEMETGFTDEAGMALAKALLEALTVNTTLRRITLSNDSILFLERDDIATMGVPAYEALTAMLRVNTNLVMEFPSFKTAGADETLCESRNRLRIEQRLNQVGRGRLLASRHTTREEYVYALHVLNSYNIDDSPAFQVSCLYSLLLLHPFVCMT
jgi:hypothetical protein